MNTTPNAPTSLFEAIVDNNPQDVAWWLSLGAPLKIVEGAVMLAVKHNRVACLDVLVSTHPLLPYTNAFYAAALNGLLECVQLLSPYVTKAAYGQALISAAADGHTSTVVFLSHKIEEQSFLNTALRNAALYQQYDCVNVLYPLAQIDEVLRLLHKYFINRRPDWGFLEERYNAAQQKTTLVGAVGAVEHTSLVSKL